MSHTLCGGGTSSAKPGFGASVSVGVAQLAALLNNVPTPIAVALAGYLGLIAYDLSTFCLQDPPPMPTITAGDWAAALLLTSPVSHLQALQKFQDLYANLLWPVFCQCDTTTTPPPPAPPTPPTNLPTVNPPQLPSAGCFNVNYQGSPPNIASPFPQNGGVSLMNLFPTGPTITAAFADGTTATAVQIPTNCTSIQWSLNPFVSSGFAQNDVSITTWDASGGNRNGFGIDTTAGVGPYPCSGTAPIGPNMQYWYAQAKGAAGSGPGSPLTFSLTGVCGGALPPTGLGCCQDPAQIALLNALLNLSNLIYQGLPTTISSYAESTVHAGLSGSGSLALGAGVIAVKVQLTTIPPYLGQDTGNPTFHFDAGFITSSAVEGNYQSQRVEFTPQLFALPPLTDQVHYTLAGGVVATITELVRGP